jgi:FkbM family methyltransferase
MAEMLLGSAYALKYSRRELPKLDQVVALTRGRTAAVQAGGNLGLFAARLAKTFTTIYTFEPAPDTFAMLTKNAPQANIIKFQAALGDTRGLIGLSRVRRDAKAIPSHEGMTYVQGPGTIPTLHIDDLGLTVCDLIYLDIEGSELPAVRGGLQTLARCRPLLAVEVNVNQEHAGVSRDTLRQTITRAGYGHVMTLSPDEVYAPLEWGMPCLP